MKKTILKEKIQEIIDFAEGKLKDDLGMEIKASLSVMQIDIDKYIKNFGPVKTVGCHSIESKDQYSSFFHPKE